MILWPEKWTRGGRMIDSYGFGRIVIDGKRFTSDVIIYPDRVDGSWWRREGHLLHIEDLKGVAEENPEVLVVGTGSPGFLRVRPETEEFLKSKGIELIVEPTKTACHTYNELVKTKKIIAALHLTC